MRVESMTLDVSQSATELKVENATKRTARPEGTRGRGGRMGGGDGIKIYNLDGKEETAPVTGGQIGGIETRKAEFDKNKLKITSTRKINSQMGELILTTKEVWEIANGGKTLKIVRVTETPRGNMSSEMVFTKK